MAARDQAFAGAARLMLSADPNGPLRSLEQRQDRMDEAGIDSAVLSLPPPSVFFPDVELAVSVTPRVNDELIAAAADGGGRLTALAAVPLPDVDAAVSELERVSQSSHVRGVGLMTQMSPWQLDDACLRAVFSCAADLGLPVVLHPQLEPVPAAYQDWALTASLAPIVSSSLGALRLIFSGTLDDVPDLVPIVPHLGGTIPFNLQRLVDQSDRGDAWEPLEHYCRERLYYDNCSYHPPALRCAVETVGAKRLMAGSDYPFRGPMGRCMEFVETSGLPADDIRSILGETAATWFDPARPPRRAPDQAAATSRTRAAMEPGVGNTLDSSAGL
jgi:aminocarboxymuconate-semialdehyde decarboxylase